MEHATHCLDCNENNKGADVFDLGFGSEIQSLLLCFPLLEEIQAILLLLFPASDNCLVRDSEADDSLLRNDRHLLHFLYHACRDIS